MVTIIFQISDATPIIRRLLIRVISGLKVNFNYLWDLDEKFYDNQISGYNWPLMTLIILINNLI